ncbi:MAG: hypothetical protein RL641_862 [Candidatus Parcubacteria bacterium]|jgi:hypothetical protein
MYRNKVLEILGMPVSISLFFWLMFDPELSYLAIVFCILVLLSFMLIPTKKEERQVHEYEDRLEHGYSNLSHEE